jgi:FHA domain
MFGLLIVATVFFGCVWLLGSMFAGSKVGGTVAVRGCGMCLLWGGAILLGLIAIFAFNAATNANDSSKIVLLVTCFVAGCLAWGAWNLATALGDAPVPTTSDPPAPCPNIVYVPFQTPNQGPSSAPTQPISQAPSPSPSPTQVIPPYSPFTRKGFLLAVIGGPLIGRSFEIFGICEVGRGTTGIDLTGDDSVSGYHALFVAEAKCIRVADSGSKNGTFINGQRVSAGEAYVGDIIRVGNTSMKVEAPL